MAAVVTGWLNVLRRYLVAMAVGNLIWEFAHMPLYSLWETGTPREIAFAALHCTGGDVLIATSALLAALVLFGSSQWPEANYRRVGLATVLTGLCYTVFSEWLNIVANPEVIVEAMQNLERKQREAEQTEAQAALATHRDELLNSPESPVGGNPQGDVTLVEFFDYNCPYCRQVAPAMVEAEDGDPQLRIVYKEFPILGPNSVFAARAALAARRQNLYPQFHKAMMQVSGTADEAQVIAVAEEIGLNLEQLRTDMQDPAIDAEIERNLALARALRINGTPGFVIGDEILRGATDLQTMQRLIDQARKDQNR